MAVANEVVKMQNENAELRVALVDTRRELLSKVQHTSDEVRTEMNQFHKELKSTMSHNQTKQVDHNKMQIAGVLNSVQMLHSHLDGFSKEQVAHRREYDTKLQNVINMFNKTFTEFMSDAAM